MSEDKKLNKALEALEAAETALRLARSLFEGHFDLRPKGIIASLNLLRPIYSRTAAYGHFGRDEVDFTWETTDKAAALRADAGL